MANTRGVKRKAQIMQTDCVACGCCVKVCPRDAIVIFKGLFAEIDSQICVGCGKCVKECPAGIISIREATP